VSSPFPAPASIRRIVSLVPSLTETLFELGVGDRLVGCTRYCTHPEALLRYVPRVGGTKNPDLQRVLDLRPDLVLANTEENRAEDIGYLAEKVAVHESMPRTVQGAAEVVRALGTMLGADDDAEAILLAIEAQSLRAEAEAHSLRRLRAFYPIWRKPWMTVNQDTYVHDVLRCAGADNVAAGHDERYPVVDEVAFADLGVDVVLLPSEPYLFGPTHRQEILAGGWFGARTPVLLVDGRDFCWHGSHTPVGMSRVFDLLMPLRARA
jgi:ABC-type Fe3+-hydroxamate transport system substrate-binding protein